MIDEVGTHIMGEAGSEVGLWVSHPSVTHLEVTRWSKKLLGSTELNFVVAACNGLIKQQRSA